jgi:hypothetical protein
MVRKRNYEEGSSAHVFRKETMENNFSEYKNSERSGRKDVAE